MKLGVLTVPLYGMDTEGAFKYLSSLGVQTVELGTGGAPGDTHCKAGELLDDPAKLAAYKELLNKYGLAVSALSVHSNPVHPDKAQAVKAHSEFITTCKLAQKFGLDTVVTFSGCPGDWDGAKYPNWVTCPWPTDYTTVLEYQWNEVLIPYWRKTVAEAAEYGVTKIALEMHPGFCVYNPGTLLRLRAAAGDAIGANFDPSHLFWQGIDPVDAIRQLKGAIHHFHAKDCKIDESNTRINGVLDAGNYGDIINRSWVFRTIGYGHDFTVWKAMISMLRVVGYNGAVSIEHEDGLMSVKEGLEKAIAFLKDVILFEDPAEMWWA